MPPAARKIRRRRPGELLVEQTHDTAVITTMLRKASMPNPELFPGVDCFLVAYLGDDAIGIVGLATDVDLALMRPLFVVENMRGNGVGARLVSAARLAAHTRGVRTLYAPVLPACVDYLIRFGFEETNLTELVNVLGSGSMLQRTQLLKTPECRALHLDISRDGLVER